MKLSQEQENLLKFVPSVEVRKMIRSRIKTLMKDIKKTYKILTDAGITVTSPKPIGSSLQSFLYDPAGNRLEIHQIA